MEFNSRYQAFFSQAKSGATGYGLRMVTRKSTKAYSGDGGFAWSERLRDRMSFYGWGIAELSRRSGVPYENLSKYVQGKVANPRGDILEKIARALGVNIVWLSFGEGPMLSRIPVVGYVSGGDEWVPFDDHAMGAGLDYVEFALDEVDPIAVQVRGRSMAPVYRDGDTLMGGRSSDPSDFLSRDCLVQTITGATYVKTVLRGSTAGTFRLRSYNPDYQDIEDVKLIWAAPIHWIKRG